MKEFKKLSKEELKTISAGGRCSTCNGGGNNNPPQGGNDDGCGNEPAHCQSVEWTNWYNCKVSKGSVPHPSTFTCY